MRVELFESLCRNKFSVMIAGRVGKLMPAFNKLKKYKNILAAPYFIYFQKPKIKNNPVWVRIAPISVCNYKCLFCEIHKDNLLYPNRPENVVDLNVIQNYESFLSTGYKLSFFGGSEEPLLNRDFGNIVKYLKSKYGIKMMVNTNASMLNRQLADTLVKYSFDSILVSYHAGSKESYKELMTGSIDRVDENLKYLKERKERLSKEKPVVEFNFALQKLNAKEYSSIFKKANQLGVSAVVVNQYYGGRNRLQDRKVSYDYDMEQGNRVLDEIYAYAKKENVNLLPKKPQYWNKVKAQWEPENFDVSKKCTLPWTNIHFNPVLSDRDCHYVGVCNRIELFKVAYDKIQFRTQEQFDHLWNHPALQYLRKTANSKEAINPICKCCKNYDTATLRNIDAPKYAALRDQAVKDFFVEFRKQCHYSEINGLEVLKENPYSDKKFQEKLTKSEAC
jgi:MoaA/NifB/PqqE/SkfB family radical SAM enzyme